MFQLMWMVHRARDVVPQFWWRHVARLTQRVCDFGLFERHNHESAQITKIMAVTLGKRKRAAGAHQDGNSDDSDAEARALFQRAFEAKFKALDKPVVVKQQEVEEDDSEDRDDDDDESDWDGLPDDESGRVQVIDHGASNDMSSEMTREELKAFMVGSSELA